MACLTTKYFLNKNNGSLFYRNMIYFCEFIKVTIVSLVTSLGSSGNIVCHKNPQCAEQTSFSKIASQHKQFCYHNQGKTTVINAYLRYTSVCIQTSTVQRRVSERSVQYSHRKKPNISEDEIKHKAKQAKALS